MGLNMALELLPESFWRLICNDSPIGFRQTHWLVAFEDVTKGFIDRVIGVSVWLIGDVQNGHGPVILSHPERM